MFRFSRRLVPLLRPLCVSSHLPRRLSAAPHSSSSLSSPKDLNFDDAKAAFAAKSFSELVRAYLIFRLCGVQIFVRNAGNMWRLMEKLLGPTIASAIVRETFFRHFCAGETEEEIRPVVARFQNLGVGSILDYAAEKDVVETKENLSPSDGVVSARQFEYESEKECDNNAKISLEAIRAAAENSAKKGGGGDGFAAVKMTALGRPEFLMLITNILNNIRQVFRGLDIPPASNPLEDFSTNVDWSEFVASLKAAGVVASEKELKEIFDLIDINRDGHINYREWIESLRPETIHSHPFIKLFTNRNLSNVKNSSSIVANIDSNSLLLSEQNQKELSNLLSRVEALAEEASKCGVKLMIDAEQTYFQPAIDHIVHLLQQKYNKTKPVIFQTIQCYLTDSYDRTMLELQRAEAKNFCFGVKLVRGAYMYQERARAAEMSYIDPIFPRIELTHENYHRVLSAIITSIPKTRAEVMVASHNESTVRFTTQLMKEGGVSRGVYFGQLMGMCDYISLTLGANGFKVYKYVPYGPVKYVMPYLLRRAEENSDLITGGAGKECRLLKQEIFRRVWPF